MSSKGATFRLFILSLLVVILLLSTIIAEQYEYFLVIAPSSLPSVAPTNTTNITPQPSPTVISDIQAKSAVINTDMRLNKWLKKIPQAFEQTEYISVIVMPEQKNYIFKGKELQKVYTISTGSDQAVMPEGIWQIGEKCDLNLGDIYGPRLMFLKVWNGKEFAKTTRAFHGTNELEKIGTNFGLGCVYHNNDDIIELYNLLPQGTIVITTNDNQPEGWEILIGGTVVLSRGVDERIRKYKNVNYPWEEVSSLTKSANLTIVNLKSPFVQNCPYVPDKMVFCSQASYVKGLTFAGVDIVSIAGNHIGDYGDAGILYTIQVLQDNKIFYTGAGSNKNEAYQSQIIELIDSSGKSLKIGFLSFNTVAGTAPVAGESSTGIVYWDERELRSIIGNLTPEVKLLVVMPNWGLEYIHQPTAEQIDMGHKLIDWGVDVVAGDQAHWIQKYEEYNNGLIFYGLGNFIFDQMWSQKTREGVLLKLIIDLDNNIAYELLPIIIENYAQPRLANDIEAKKILGNIK